MFYVADSFTSLLLHMNDVNGSTVFKDSGINPKTVTAFSGAKISTLRSKFGGSSGYCDGVAAYVNISDSTDFSFGSADFTIELWAYSSNYSGTIISKNNAGSGFSPFHINGQLLYMSSAGVSWDVANGISLGVLPINRWIHIALVRYNNTISAYVNGILVCNFSYSGSLYNPANAIRLGGSSLNWLECYYDEIRISTGIARWKGSFTPPYDFPGLVSKTFIMPRGLDSFYSKGGW